MVSMAQNDSDAWYVSDSDDSDHSSSDSTAADNCAGRIVLGVIIGALTGGLFG